VLRNASGVREGERDEARKALSHIPKPTLPPISYVILSATAERMLIIVMAHNMRSFIPTANTT
jgi:hypothetical protein